MQRRQQYFILEVYLVEKSAPFKTIRYSCIPKLAFHSEPLLAFPNSSKSSNNVMTSSLQCTTAIWLLEMAQCLISRSCFFLKHNLPFSVWDLKHPFNHCKSEAAEVMRLSIYLPTLVLTATSNHIFTFTEGFCLLCGLHSCFGYYLV